MHVVAGVIRDSSGRVLVAQRPAGKHLAGGWEFPGGKLDGAETPFAALRRELDEELGIAVGAAHPLIRIRHDYPDRRVLLDVWTVTEYRGTPLGRDGQNLRWCEVEALATAQLLPADRPVITALRLPERLTATATAVYRLDADAAGREDPGRLFGAYCEDLPGALSACAAGADFLALRRRLDRGALAALCEAVAVPVYARDIEPEEAWRLGASGTCAL